MRDRFEFPGSHIERIRITDDGTTIVVDVIGETGDSCKHCDSKNIWLGKVTTRTLKDLPIDGKAVKIVLHRKCYACQSCDRHGTFNIPIEDNVSNVNHNMTPRLLEAIEGKIGRQSNKSIAREMKITDSVVARVQKAVKAVDINTLRRLNLDLPDIRVDRVNISDNKVEVEARSTRRVIACKSCGCSELVRSKPRKPVINDTPYRGKRVVIHLRGSFYRCKNCGACQKCKTLLETGAIKGMTLRSIGYAFNAAFKEKNHVTAKIMGVHQYKLESVLEEFGASGR